MRFIVTSSVVTFIVLCYLGWIWVCAKMEVKNTERTPMFVCPKHGPITASETLVFYGTQTCPLCFHAKMKAADKGQLS